MNGKGDKRRPKFVDEQLFEANWQLAFKQDIDAMFEKTKQEVSMAFGLVNNNEQERNQ